MRDLLKEILEKYPNARATTAFGGQHEIRSLFEDLKESIRSLDFIKNNQNLLVKYSYGKGIGLKRLGLQFLMIERQQQPKKEHTLSFSSEVMAMAVT